MKARFAIAAPLAAAPSLAWLRAWPKIDVCVSSETVWLRAVQLADAQWDACRRVPGADRFAVLDDGQLLPVGAAVPRGYLPAGPSQSLAEWLRVELPASWAPAAPPAAAQLSLVRSHAEEAPSWLLTDLDRWGRYAATAPQVRLARWSFAATASGQTVVRGTPLPPLAGEQLVDREGIVVPAGWTWTPGVEPAVLRQLLALASGDAALWLPGEPWQAIREPDWVRASRSAVRLTLEELPRAGA